MALYAASATHPLELQQAHGDLRGRVAGLCGPYPEGFSAPI